MTTDTPASFQKKVSWGADAGSLDVDIHCAVISRGGVLITGPAERAEAVAREIHRRVHPASSRAQVVDCSDEDAVMKALDSSAPSEPEPVLMRNVDRLSLSLQARLLARTSAGWRRIICWSTDAPDDRLVPQLLYRLNIIRIDLWTQP